MVLWVAVTMACAWLVVPFSGIDGADALGFAGIVVAVPGILLIAPISAISQADPRATLGKRIWEIRKKFSSRLACSFRRMRPPWHFALK
jgi:uncharacterized RDD family membrane protein YckC